MITFVTYAQKLTFVNLYMKNGIMIVDLLRKIPKNGHDIV
jgi:hypothetical protein